MMKLATCFTLCFFFVQCVLNLSAFSIPTASTTTSFISASTTTAPPREKTKRKTKFGSSTKERTRRSFRVKAPGGGSPLEYLRDDLTLMPKDDDPFHIILLGSTFEKPRTTVNYVASSLEYVLGMPSTEAKEHAEFSKEQGMACLGTWKHEECLVLGKQLQNRDLVCRVVPFCEGGNRGWQAKDASDSSSGGVSDEGFL